MEFVWVGVGGAIGAMARHAVTLVALRLLGPDFPFGTLTVNVTGSLAIGAILTVLLDRPEIDPAWRWLLVVGFLGGYTTFSSYAFDAIRLAEAGHGDRALAYVLASNLAGLLACAAGIALVRALTR